MKSIVVLFTIAVVLFASGRAPASSIIVDNSADTSDGSQTLTGGVGSVTFTGQGFVMGGSSESLGTIAAAVNVGASLSVYNANTSGPTSLLTSLTDTGTQNGHGDEIYTPNSPTTLVAGQTYIVVMGGTGNTWSYTLGGSTNNLGTMQTDRGVTFQPTPTSAGGWFQPSGAQNYEIQVNVKQPAGSVPEIEAGSAASALAVLGCAVAMLRGRRRHSVGRMG